jgi:hypothetical protein
MTSVRASYSYYFATKSTWPTRSAGLATQPGLVWATNSTTATAARGRTGAGLNITDRAGQRAVARRHRGQSRFNTTTDLRAGGQHGGSSARIGPHREFITASSTKKGRGVDPQPDVAPLPPDLRRVRLPQVRPRHEGLYDRFTEREAGYPISYAILGPFQFTDDDTGKPRLFTSLPDLHAAIRSRHDHVDKPNYQVYNGLVATVNKRLAQVADERLITCRDTRSTRRIGDGVRPIETSRSAGPWSSSNGLQHHRAIPVQASTAEKNYVLPWDVQVLGQPNINEGANRTVSMMDPAKSSACVGQGAPFRAPTPGVPADGTTASSGQVLDLGFQKSFAFSGGRYIGIQGECSDIFKHVPTPTTIPGWKQRQHMSSRQHRGAARPDRGRAASCAIGAPDSRSRPTLGPFDGLTVGRAASAVRPIFFCVPGRLWRLDPSGEIDHSPGAGVRNLRRWPNRRYRRIHESGLR